MVLMEYLYVETTFNSLDNLTFRIFWPLSHPSQIGGKSIKIKQIWISIYNLLQRMLLQIWQVRTPYCRLTSWVISQLKQAKESRQSTATNMQGAMQINIQNPNKSQIHSDTNQTGMLMEFYTISSEEPSIKIQRSYDPKNQNQSQQQQAKVMDTFHQSTSIISHTHISFTLPNMC